MLIIAAIALGVLGLVFGGLCAWRLHHWERQLRGARIGIFYKGKLKMDPPLIDFLRWANTLEGDPSRTGRGVYQFGATTVTILKRHPPSKAKTITRKEGTDGRTRPLHNLAQRRRAQSTRNTGTP